LLCLVWAGGCLPTAAGTADSQQDDCGQNHETSTPYDEPKFPSQAPEADSSLLQLQATVYGEGVIVGGIPRVASRIDGFHLEGVVPTLQSLYTNLPISFAIFLTASFFKSGHNSGRRQCSVYFAIRSETFPSAPMACCRGVGRDVAPSRLGECWDSS
jgi:hypothetical protein